MAIRPIVQNILLQGDPKPSFGDRKFWSMGVYTVIHHIFVSKKVIHRILHKKVIHHISKKLVIKYDVEKKLKQISPSMYG